MVINQMNGKQDAEQALIVQNTKDNLLLLQNSLKMFEIIVGVIALIAILNFINSKFLQLSQTLGVLILFVGVSLILASSFFKQEKNKPAVS